MKFIIAFFLAGLSSFAYADRAQKQFEIATYAAQLLKIENGQSFVYWGRSKDSMINVCRVSVKRVDDEISVKVIAFAGRWGVLNKSATFRISFTNSTRAGEMTDSFATNLQGSGGKISGLAASSLFKNKDGETYMTEFAYHPVGADGIPIFGGVGGTAILISTRFTNNVSEDFYTRSSQPIACIIDRDSFGKEK
jgi:hypothetical protein